MMLFFIKRAALAQQPEFFQPKGNKIKLGDGKAFSNIHLCHLNVVLSRRFNVFLPPTRVAKCYSSYDTRRADSTLPSTLCHLCIHVGKKFYISTLCDMHHHSSFKLVWSITSTLSVSIYIRWDIYVPSSTTDKNACYSRCVPSTEDSIWIHNRHWKNPSILSCSSSSKPKRSVSSNISLANHSQFGVMH